MTTEGIEAVFLETHNWGKSAKFFQALGYEIEFATDHNSGQLRRGNGPSLFIAEVPESEPTRRHLVLAVADALTLSDVADQIVIAVRWAETPLAVAIRGLHQIHEASSKVAGVVLTLVNQRHARYGLGDSGFFYRKVRRYYSS